MLEATDQLDGVAIIGMVARFPDAPNLEQFWKNLCAGVESVTSFTDQQLRAAGVAPDLLESHHYVKSGVLLEGIELFDAKFFGFTPREAELTDPQHRIFLECAWEALEDAGYDPDRSKARIGVFAGAGTNNYFRNNLLSNLDLMSSLNHLQQSIAVESDYLATRVSYKLNLKGPSFTIQSACSTSLVATHVACQSLLNGECDMALAGGAFIKVPQVAGYLHQEGSQQSSDGHCRAFDASAKGMVGGSGAAVIVLKRLTDALRDSDCIRAVIRGSAINNDGAEKIGFTAPSVEGQATAIAEAQAMAGVNADDITYIEAHGTGTILGDPIEIAALTKAFRRTSKKMGFCAIGSVKTNIGHLGPAAGVAGLIKVVLSMQNRTLPRSLNFERPNPAIDFANSPFYVQQKLDAWHPASGRRVAGISSFGIGGTNAHAILEEAPHVEALPERESWQVLPISAKSPEALEKATARMAMHLANHPDAALRDVAFTLQQGRKPFAQRRIVAAKSKDEAAELLRKQPQDRVFTGSQEPFDCPLAFMFPGQAAQHVNMGLEVYRAEKQFRDCVDLCCELLKPHLGFDLRRALYPAEDSSAAAEQLNQTAVTQPAMFVVEYALARLWMEWGVHPDALIGHSIGEYVAACLAGVFSLQDALSLVAARGRLMQSMPRGAMLAVRMDEESIRPYLGDQLSLAVINGPSACVAAGPEDAIRALQTALAEQEINSRLLPTSHAFHSPMMEPILASFQQLFQNIPLRPPNIPFLSNVTGNWMTPAQATDPGYWCKQLRQTVRFADGIGELLKTPRRILLEVGPGHTLTSLAQQHPAKTSGQLALASLSKSSDTTSEMGEIMTALGRLWIAGVSIDWLATTAGEKRRRVPLPTYPFERQRCWIEPQPSTPTPPRLGEVSLGYLNIQVDAGDAQEAQLPANAAVPGEQPQAPGAKAEDLTDLQKTIAAVWREVLGFGEIGIDENFFALGGDSLLSIQVTSRLRALLRIALPPSALIEAPTIAGLASYIIAHESTPGEIERTAQLLRKIEGMTEEELTQACAQEGLL